jgi:hypothetical protein
MTSSCARTLWLSLPWVLAISCSGKSIGNAQPAHETGAGGLGESAGASTGGATSTTGQGGEPASAGGTDTRPASYRCIGPCPDGPARPVPSARPKCPTLEPNNGDACPDATLTCSYGDAPAAPCRDVYECQQGGAGLTWTLDPTRQISYPCTALPAGYCPATPPDQLSACTLSSYNTPCVYGSLLCYCGGTGDNLQPGVRGMWDCVGPPADQDCPATLPNLGEGCASPGTECDYAEGCLDPETGNVLCHDGAWELGTPYTCIGK